MTGTDGQSEKTIFVCEPTCKGGAGNNKFSRVHLLCFFSVFSEQIKMYKKSYNNYSDWCAAKVTVLCAVMV